MLKAKFGDDPLSSCVTLAYFLVILNMLSKSFPANIYLLKVSNRSTRKMRGICSKLTTKTPKQRQ